MKKRKIVIVLISLSIIFLAILISGIMLRTEIENLNENLDNKMEETGYIEIRHLGSSQKEITDTDIINAIIQELNCMEIKKRHPYKEFISDCTSYLRYANKSAFYIKGRDEKGGNVLFELTIYSNNSIELNDNLYYIKNNTYIYDILDCYSHTGYSAPLPDVTAESILEFNLYGEVEYTKTDFIITYEKILNSRYVSNEEGVQKSKSITKDEFEASDSYISIKTIDEEFIDMYFVGDKIYIKYQKEKMNRECCTRVSEKYGDIISNLEIERYYVYE